MELIVSLIKSAIFSILVGTVLLIVAVFVLPEKVFLNVMRRLKPDLVSRQRFLAKVRIIFDYIFNKKETVIEDLTTGATKEIQENLKHLMKEKRLLEGNLFFLDLLKNLANMLRFSVLHAGYGEEVLCSILDQSMEYLQYYARQLEDTESSKNLQERIVMAAERLKMQVNDTSSFLRQEEGDHKMMIVKETLKQGTSIFDQFMKDEYESNKENLHKTNQLLAQKFMQFLDL